MEILEPIAVDRPIESVKEAWKFWKRIYPKEDIVFSVKHRAIIAHGSAEPHCRNCGRIMR